jgi:hypothetical protein
MTMIIVALMLILIGLALSCQTKENNQLTEQEYAVYLTVVGDRPKNFIVVHEDVDDVFGAFSSGKVPELVPGILPETIDDYVVKNRTPLTIAKDFPFKDGFKVIRTEEVHKFMSEYDRFYSVSRVGFSKNGKQAFVLFNDVCSPLCGEGAFYLLTNNNGLWTIETKSESWKS